MARHWDGCLHVVSRGAGLAAILLMLSASVASAQVSQCFMLRIEHPTGEVFQISTREGPATAGFQIKDGEKYPTFYIDLATREQEQDAVRVTIRDGRRADSTVLHEFVLNSGGPAVRTATAPSFSLAFTGTHPPKNYGSSCFREQAMPLVPGFPPSP